MYNQNSATGFKIVIWCIFILVLLAGTAQACGVKHAAEAGLKSVVSIYTVTDGKPTGVGSGVIIESSGTIVTNAHVVSDGDYWFAVLPDGRHVGVSIVKRDENVDLALVRVNFSDMEGRLWPELPAIHISDAAISAGDQVIAIGNPFNTGIAVTSGVMSGNRSIKGVPHVQHDAAVNHGNSGGALLNDAGELVGINVAIFAVNDAFVGIAWAIPTSELRKFLGK
jgi:S1-C subfamily serine protease